MNGTKMTCLLLLLSFSLVTGQGNPNITFDLVREIEADLSYPTDICGDGEGAVFILDAMNNRVVHLQSNGAVVSITPQRESIYKAVGIACIGGDLWIADTPRSRLLKVELNGRISQVVQLDHQTEPVDVIAVGEYLAITDRRNHAIMVLDEAYQEKYFWGSRGEAIGEFINPGFIASGPENRLFIGDILNRRVISFSPSGRFPQVVAKPGVELGQIFRPKGIVVDAQKRVWVADGYTGAIQAFSIAGKFQGVASQDGAPLALSSPMGMYLDAQDQLWVVESFASKVSVWKIK